MSDIFNKLNSIKGRLADLETNFDVEIKKEEGRAAYNERMKEKMANLRLIQNSRIKINLGNEETLECARNTIENFPYQLSLKSEISGKNEIFIDSSPILFSVIIDIIRITKKDEDIKKVASSVPSESVKAHAMEYFLEDTEEVLKRIEIIYVNPFIKQVPTELKKKKNKNKWGPNDYIMCYGCSAVNSGDHWRKRCSYDRANDSYCIDFFIATCLNCDPDNTRVY